MLSSIANTNRGVKRDAVQVDVDAKEVKRAKRGKDNKHKENKTKEVVIKGAWSPEEDKEMLRAVEKFGTDWKSIAKCVTGRTAKQCRDRYKLKLDPAINHGPWKPAEDATLLRLHGEMGRQWTKIAKLMNGRTENSVKSRYASLQRSRTREWTDEEDAILRIHREREVSFEEISRLHLPNRSEHAVKKRWERLFMRDLARKIRSEMPTSSSSQQFKPRSSFPINPRLVTSHAVPKYADVLPNNQGIKAETTLTNDAPFNRNYGSAGEVIFRPQVQTEPLGQASSESAQVQPFIRSSRQAKFKRHSTSVTVMMQLIGEPLNK